MNPVDPNETRRLKAPWGVCRSLREQGHRQGAAKGDSVPVAALVARVGRGSSASHRLALLVAAFWGGYQLANPYWMRAAAASGVMVPSTTDCDTSASSVVSDGSPRVRNCAPRRKVESQVSRQPIMVLATGSLSSKK